MKKIFILLTVTSCIGTLVRIWKMADTMDKDSESKYEFKDFSSIRKKFRSKIYNCDFHAHCVDKEMDSIIYKECSKSKNQDLDAKQQCMQTLEKSLKKVYKANKTMFGKK